MARARRDTPRNAVRCDPAGRTGPLGDNPHRRVARRAWCPARCAIRCPAVTSATLSHPHAPETSAFLVRWAAALWGFVVFMPLGVNYLALFLLMITMLLQGPRMDRLRRVRNHPLLLPMLLYIAWTLVVLATQSAYYAETPSNLWHALRIVLTIALALALTREEASMALRGFLVAAVVSVLIIALGHTVGLPMWNIWEKLLVYGGNKAISNALLLALLAGSGVVLALRQAGRFRWIGLGMAAVALLCLLVSLPNRTSLLLLVLAVPATALHQWRQQRARIATAVVLTAIAASLFVTTVPPVRANLETGVGEVQQALNGEVARLSWNIRVQMIRHTTEMIAERPWMGWGIGGWNDQWRRRVPPMLSDLNMPHNDFLWNGSQAGLPGALIWLSIPLVALWTGWRRRDLTGRLGFIAALVLLVSALVNSAMRDAAIGLSLLWIGSVVVRLASDPDFVFEPEAMFRRARD